MESQKISIFLDWDDEIIIALYILIAKLISWQSPKCIIYLKYVVELKYPTIYFSIILHMTNFGTALNEL